MIDHIDNSHICKSAQKAQKWALIVNVILGRDGQ